MARASWKINRSLGTSGPWVIQLAITKDGGARFRPPRPEHTKFATRKDAESARKSLPHPFITQGIVVDGLDVAGVMTGPGGRNPVALCVGKVSQ